MIMIASIGVSVHNRIMMWAGCVVLVLALLVSVAVVGVADVGFMAVSGTPAGCESGVFN